MQTTSKMSKSFLILLIVLLLCIIGSCKSAFKSNAHKSSNIIKTQKETWLFVQSSDSGSLKFNEADKTYTVILKGASPLIVRFTDTPVRKADTVTSEKFVKEWHNIFKKGNPNAAIVAILEDLSKTVPIINEDIGVCTITDASYDKKNQTMTYIVKAIPGQKGFLIDNQGKIDNKIPKECGPLLMFIDSADFDDIDNYAHKVPEIGSTKVISDPKGDFPNWQSTDGEYLNTEFSTWKGYKYGNYIFRAYYNFDGITKNACGSTFLYSKYPMNQSPYINYARWRELDFEYVPYQFANKAGDVCSGKTFGTCLEGTKLDPKLTVYRFVSNLKKAFKFYPDQTPNDLITKNGIALAQMDKDGNPLFQSWDDLKNYCRDNPTYTIQSEYPAGDYVWKNFGVTFKLTEEILNKLLIERIPQDIIELMKPLINQEFIGEEEFIAALEKNVAQDKIARWEVKILKYAATKAPENPFSSISFGPHFMIPGNYSITGDIFDYTGKKNGTFNGTVITPDSKNNNANKHKEWPIATPGGNYAMSTSFFYDKNNIMNDGKGYNGQGWYYYRFELLPSGIINYYIGEGDLPTEGAAADLNSITWYKVGMQPADDICNSNDFFSDDTLAKLKWWYEGKWRESGQLVGMMQLWFQKNWGDGTPDMQFVNMFFDYAGFYPISADSDSWLPDWYVNTSNWNADNWPDKFNNYFIQDKYVPGSVTFGDPDNTTNDSECKEALQLRIFQLSQIEKYYSEGKNFAAFCHTFSNKLATDYPDNPSVLVAYYSKSDDTKPYLIRLWVNYDTENNGVQYAADGTILRVYEIDKLDDQFVDSSGNFKPPTQDDISKLTEIGNIKFSCDPDSGRTVYYNSYKGKKFQAAVIAQPKVVTGITPFQIQILTKDEQLPTDPVPMNPFMENINFGFALPPSIVKSITFTVDGKDTNSNNPDKSKGQRLSVSFKCKNDELPKSVKAIFTNDMGNTEEVDVNIKNGGWEISNGQFINIYPSGPPDNYDPEDKTHTQFVTIPVSAINQGFPLHGK
ncbi:MAG: hypothetical protein HQK79_05620 [Desulfobacterales bacterium]|nr:hypothetical protein [Desulfobacterales bacterium]